MKKVLITGANGFLGHYLVEEFIKDYKVICLLRPGTTNLKRLEPFKDRIKIIYHDITKPGIELLDKLQDVELILHAAGNPSAEDSIKNPLSVITHNVVGTTNILDIARNLPLKRFFFYGAGEVFGPVDKDKESHEDDKYNSVSPYAASKASGEELCIAYNNTFNVPVSILHITNTFGPRLQLNRFPVIVIKKILENKQLLIHQDSLGNISGRRWLHAQDVANHTRFILEHQKTKCEKWNSVGLEYITNLEFAQMIAKCINNQPLNYDFVLNARVGNEPKFCPSPSKLVNHGWKEPLNIYQRIEDTVKWYLSNKDWL